MADVALFTAAASLHGNYNQNGRGSTRLITFYGAKISAAAHRSRTTILPESGQTITTVGARSSAAQPPAVRLPTRLPAPPCPSRIHSCRCLL
jgi:hypothetical protein